MKNSILENNEFLEELCKASTETIALELLKQRLKGCSDAGVIDLINNGSINVIYKCVDITSGFPTSVEFRFIHGTRIVVSGGGIFIYAHNPGKQIK